MDAIEEKRPSQLAKALANLDRVTVAKTINAGAWQSTSVEEVREVANKALKESGLALHFCESTSEILEGGIIKCRVQGLLEYGPTGESRPVCGEVLDTPSTRQPMVQQCGSLYSYAAKFAIVNSLNLPRGGDDSAELAHTEKRNAQMPQSPPRAAVSIVPQRSPDVSRSRVQESTEHAPPAAVEASGYYGDPGKNGTERGLDHFVVTQVEVFREGTKTNKKGEQVPWRIWKIHCACGTSFSTFADQWADEAQVALQADGDVEIGWTRNEKGYPELADSWQTRKFIIDGVSAGEHDHVKVIQRPAPDTLGDQIASEIAAREEERNELPV